MNTETFGAKLYLRKSLEKAYLKTVQLICTALCPKNFLYWFKTEDIFHLLINRFPENVE